LLVICACVLHGCSRTCRIVEHRFSPCTMAGVLLTVFAFLLRDTMSPLCCSPFVDCGTVADCCVLTSLSSCALCFAISLTCSLPVLYSDPSLSVCTLPSHAFPLVHVVSVPLSSTLSTGFHWQSRSGGPGFMGRAQLRRYPYCRCVIHLSGKFGAFLAFHFSTYCSPDSPSPL
jgi:hypothetical protein